MAQTLIAYYCFNDNDATLVHDFSGNQRDSTVETGFSISTASGAVGKVGVFNGTTTVLNFGNITAFDALMAFSFVTKFKTDAIGARQVILMRQGCFILEITAAGKVKLSLYSESAALYELTSAESIVASTWYTVACTWSIATGNYMRIYINELASPDEDIFDPVEMETNTNPLYIGATNTPGDYFDGMIEMVSFYEKELDDDEINTIMECPTGLRFEAGDGMIQTGDIIYNDSGGKEVCVWSEEFHERAFHDGEQRAFSDGGGMIFPN